MAESNLQSFARTLEDAFSTLTLVQRHPDLPQDVYNVIEHLIERIADGHAEVRQ